MTDVIKGTANSPQPATQGNYREVKTHDVAGIYSRKVAQQQLPVSNFAQSDLLGGKGPRDLAAGPLAFLEIDDDSEVDICAARRKGRLAADCAIKHLS